MATIGTLAVNITAKTGPFTKGIMGAQKRMAAFGAAAGKAAAVVGTFGAAMAAGAATGLGVMVKQQADVIDGMAKMSDKLGISIEKFAGLSLAAEESGVSVENLVKGMQNLEKNVSLGASGGGPKAAFARLGLDPDALLKMNPEGQFAAVSEAMNRLGHNSDKVALSMQLFGKSGVDMLNTMRGGPEVLREAQQAAERLGLVISRDAAAAVERANDAFGRFKMATVGLARQLAVRLAPIVENASKWMEKLLTDDGRVHKWANMIAAGIGSVVSSILTGVHKMRIAMAQFQVDMLEMGSKIAFSPMGKLLGLRPEGDAAVLAHVKPINEARTNLENLQGMTDPGKAFGITFNKWLDEAMRSPAVTQKGGELFSTLLNKAKGLGSSLAGRAADSVGGVFKGTQLGSMAWGKALNELSMGFAGSKFGRGMAMAGAGGGSPSLSFARTGSVESYRQRMAIGKQNETTKLAKQQLKTQQKAEQHLKEIAQKLVVTKPANF